MFHYLDGKQDTYVEAIYCIEGSGDITNDENVKQVNCPIYCRTGQQKDFTIFVPTICF